MTAILEQTAEQVINCGNCWKELSIPEADFQAIQKARELSCQEQPFEPILGKQQKGYFVSPEKHLIGKAGFYCNQECHTIFTED